MRQAWEWGHVSGLEIPLVTYLASLKGFPAHASAQEPAAGPSLARRFPAKCLPVCLTYPSPRGAAAAADTTLKRSAPGC